MPTTTKPRKTGLLVQPDDLIMGGHYAVHSLKAAPDEPVPIAGQSFQVAAINLPFVVGKRVSDPTYSPITLDVRFLDFMMVAADFVKAQAPSPASEPGSSPDESRS